MQYVSVFIQVAVLVMLAAICSGLNISLMSLSLGDLRRKAKLGNRAAKKVLPLRRDAHLSLAAILFSNMAVVSGSSLLLEHHFNGWIAGIATTLLMVVFGEVLPQAIFIKSALKTCAFFAPLIRVMIIVVYPVVKPLALLLDHLVGVEHRRLLTRAELGLLISEHKIGSKSELDGGEVEIIQSTLQLSEKTVKEIMTPIKAVQWLTLDTILDERMVNEIIARGYSRIPVFDDKLTMCHGVLLAKDMINIDFDDNPVPLWCFPLHKTRMVGARTALDTMFHKFRRIGSHLVPVEQNDRIIGIVTVEDLLEETIGHEIADEIDRDLHRN